MWASALWKAIVSIPQLLQLFEEVQNLYFDWKVNQYQGEISSRQATRVALTSAIKKASSNEERFRLARLLYDFNTSELSKSVRK